MQKFSTQAPIANQSKENYFFSQPHQLFFLFGIIWSIVSMVIFMLGFKGTIPLMISPSYFHIYALIYSVFTQFFLGFLLTTFPRFCASSAPSKRFYIATFTLYEISTCCVMLGIFIFDKLLFASVGLLLVIHTITFYKLYIIYKHGKSPIKKDPFWILVAYGFGVFSHCIFALGFMLDAYAIPIYWYDIAYASGFYLYTIFLTSVIAFRMIPFFSHIKIHQTPKLVPILFAMLIAKAISIVFTFEWTEIILDIMLGLFLMREFLRWKLPIMQSPAILWILHLALFWLPLSLIIGAIAKACELYFDVAFMSLDTHLIALGFLNTIFIGFATRVTLGHSSQPPRANRFTISLFIGTQIVVALRVLYSLSSGFSIDAPWTFDISVSAWLILFIAWGIYYGPVLIWGKKIV